MQGIFKKSAIGLAILGFAGAASAGMVTGAFFGGEGVDFQPRNGDLDYLSLIGTGETGGIVNPIATYGFHPHYSWGWRLFGGLTFCNNNDLTLSWLHYNNSTSVDPGYFASASDPTTPLPVVLRFLNEAAWSNISASVSFKVDDAYMVFGHTVNLGAWSLRFAGGLEYARINSDMSIQGIEPSIEPGLLQPPDVLIGYEAESHTHGFGPRIEIDMAYHLPYGLTAFLKPNVALLIGSRQIEIENILPVPTSELDLQDFSYSNRHVIVPKVGARIGLGFTYMFGDTGGEGGVSSPLNNCGLTLEAGWQVDTYIHAVERPVGFETPFFATNVTTKTSNLTLQGFFIGAVIGTNWV